MKMGISVWAFPENWDLQRIFATAKAVGFDGVEVALAEDGEVNLNSTKSDMQTVKKIARDNHIELYSVATGLYWVYSLTSNDDTVREKANVIVRKQLEIASWLDCNTVLVVPGLVDASVYYDVAYKRAIDAIQEHKQFAASVGVSIGIENVWNNFLLSPLEMREFINAFDSDYVGVYFDVGNVVYSGYPEHWIQLLGPYIKKVHFKDYERSLNGFVDILAGDVNYPAVMNELEKAGYDDWVTAEVGFSPDYPEQSLVNIANSMRKITEKKK